MGFTPICEWNGNIKMGIIATDGGMQIATATEYLKSRYFHHSVNEPS